jgi:hypothetical protein
MALSKKMIYDSVTESKLCLEVENGMEQVESQHGFMGKLKPLESLKF